MTTTTIPAKRLWGINDVSLYLDIPVGTLYQWRYHRTGPRAFKVGRHLRYDPADVQTWLHEQAA
ncbi:helix-turn-helix domain-containing protein [Pilimelia columellifera]|uniref:Helix-turn-helix domain-containing protein n=1 Tax=Pilimelia columellifera subsp. columellifera TaxID=706583 RepID=A0ABP6A3K9_9ACTN